MKVFLTGGTGFIGTYVIKKLLDDGHDVIALRRIGSSPVISVPNDIIWVDGTLEDVSGGEFEGIEVVIHLAAYGVNPQHNLWSHCFRWNVNASIGLWLKAIEAGVPRIIIIGSCFEYGLSATDVDFVSVSTQLQPTTPYGASKAAATMAVQAICVERDVEVAVLRPFHVFGEGEPDTRFWPALKHAALQGDDFPMTAGKQVRDFTPVELMAEKIVEHAVSRELVRGVPQIFNLGTGKTMTLKEFASQWWKKWGATGKLLVGYVPYRENEVMRYVPEVIS